jgi:hypothetical protein
MIPLKCSYILIRRFPVESWADFRSESANGPESLIASDCGNVVAELAGR